MVLNAVARLFVGSGRYQHITPILRDLLHWLRVRQRILFNVTAADFNRVCGTGPAYFKDVCKLVADIAG